MTERAHSRFPASSAARLLACPGSFALSAKAPQREGSGMSFYAAEGTVAHDIIEKALTGAREPKDWLGEEITLAGHPVPVTQDMLDAAQVFLDHADAAMAGAVAFWSEKRVSLDRLWTDADPRPPFPMFGTADLLAVHWAPRGRIILMDYKHGAGIPVEVRDNAQLLYYALAAILDLNLLGGPGQRGVGPDAMVETTIVQPRARHPEGPVRTARYPLVDVLSWGYETLRPGVARVLEPGAPLNPGPHCRFCPALSVCPALKSAALSAAQAEFSEPAPQEPQEISDAELGVLLTKIELIEPWLAAVKKEATARAHAGATIPGWKIVLKRGRRAWTDERAAREALVEAGVPFTDFLGTAPLRSPAQVEKQVPADLWTEKLAPLVGTSESPALVRAADPRPALRDSAAADFDLITEQEQSTDG